MKICFVVREGYDASWLANKFKKRHSISFVKYSNIWKTFIELLKLRADIIFYVGKEKFFLKKYKKSIFATTFTNVFFPYWKLIWRFIKFIQSRIMYLINLTQYKAIANPDKIIYINPEDVKHTTLIEFKKRLVSVRGVIKDEFPNEVNEMNFSKEKGKFGSLYIRFVKNKSWEDTPLINEFYPMAIKENKYTRGLSTKEELIVDYYTKVDSLYYKIKNNGIQLPSLKNPFIDYIFIHIGAKGEIIYTKEGNHRLSISKILKPKKIPCKVWVRHKKWQRIREVASKLSYSSFSKRYPDLLNHPDLGDVLNK